MVEFLQNIYLLKILEMENITSNIKIEGQDILEKIKETKQQVVFVSGHLSNFELMAMHLEKTGIKLICNL